MVPMPMGRTLSVAGIDGRSGEMGAAILSQSFSVGSRTIWSEPGVGVVVAQSDVEPTYGPLGLALLKGGKTPSQALKSLLATDPRPRVRQVMMVDSRGRTAAHTGNACLPESGHTSGRGFCVQASFASTKRAWTSMAAAFRGGKGERRGDGGDLGQRLVAALEAGERAAKGARRGGAARSAAVLVVSALHTNTPWEGRLMDLRVDSSDDPLKELKGMLRIQDAYAHAATGDELLVKGDIERGGREFSTAFALDPQSTALKLWFALASIRVGDMEKAGHLMRSVVGRGQDAKAIMRELESRRAVEPRRKRKEEERTEDRPT